MFVAGPIGIMAAIYLSEYASDRVRRTLKPLFEVLQEFRQSFTDSLLLPL